MNTSNSVLLKSWRISQKNPKHALFIAVTLLAMTILASILFFLLFNYHDGYDSLAELFRKPLLAVVGVYIFGSSISASLFIYRYFDMQRRRNAYLKVSDK